MDEAGAGGEYTTRYGPADVDVDDVDADVDIDAHLEDNGEYDEVEAEMDEAGAEGSSSSVPASAADRQLAALKRIREKGGQDVDAFLAKLESQKWRLEESEKGGQDV